MLLVAHLASGQVCGEHACKAEHPYVWAAEPPMFAGGPVGHLQLNGAKLRRAA